MNLAGSKLLRAGMIVMLVAAMVLARSSKAAAVTVIGSLTVTAADPVGQPITNASLMEIADSAGVTRTLAMLSPGRLQGRYHRTDASYTNQGR
jgi:hypothetical protein